jgi:hypothetical protein
MPCVCSLGQFDLYDLVALDGQTVGVIVGVEESACRVLTNQGRPDKPDVRVCRLPDLKRKLNNRRASTQDRSESGGVRRALWWSLVVSALSGGKGGGTPALEQVLQGPTSASPPPQRRIPAHPPTHPSSFLPPVGAEVNINDIIEVTDGPLRGKSGTVKYIVRGFLFVHSREFPDFGGYVCVSARVSKVGVEAPGEGWDGAWGRQLEHEGPAPVA